MWENGGENLHLDLGSERVNVRLEYLMLQTYFPGCC